MKSNTLEWIIQKHKRKIKTDARNSYKNYAEKELKFSTKHNHLYSCIFSDIETGS